ncbi:hypothetical protein [Nitratireductor arenosus]|uniref:hypothetical protein n=1 Tax=Nitratireductor arenosus TaxID=2682096 RepID=UPI0031B599CA
MQKRSASARGRRGALAALAVLALPATEAGAACPQELAVYSEREAAAAIDFRPALPGAALHAIEFKLTFAQNGVVLDGIVMHTDPGARPYGLVMHQCPEGDVTGEELAVCTIWEGPIYGIDAGGTVATMPERGTSAAAQLLLPGFGTAVRHSRIYGADGVSVLPWDVFALGGCQE